MIILHNECKHCLQEYYYQASGSYWTLDTAEEFNDPDYCPECKKAMKEALDNIPKKFEYRYVETNEVDLDTLQRWENEEYQERIKRSNGFPIVKRVYSPLHNLELEETSLQSEVSGRGEFRGRKFSYFYYPSKKEDVIIRERKKFKTNEQ